MSELTSFRDHARRMTTAEHQSDCRAKRNALALQGETVRSCPQREPHPGHKQSQWTYCPGVCGGCNTPADRVLWARLAGEIDDYLADPVAEDLFGEPAVERHQLQDALNRRAD